MSPPSGAWLVHIGVTSSQKQMKKKHKTKNTIVSWCVGPQLEQGVGSAEVGAEEGAWVSRTLGF